MRQPTSFKVVAAYSVGVTGFEPATTRPPDAYSNRAELHPERCCDRTSDKSALVPFSECKNRNLFPYDQIYFLFFEHRPEFNTQLYLYHYDRGNHHHPRSMPHPFPYILCACRGFLQQLSVSLSVFFINRTLLWNISATRNSV